MHSPSNNTFLYHHPIIYQYPQVGDETGGPTLAWEATREGVDDYKYLFTLQKLTEELTTSGDQRANRARVLWRKIERQLSRIDFNGSTGSAAQGDWTGRKELSPEGDKVVSGDHKMANGFRFSDYNELRRKIADAIIELTNHASSVPLGSTSATPAAVPTVSLRVNRHFRCTISACDVPLTNPANPTDSFGCDNDRHTLRCPT